MRIDSPNIKGDITAENISNATGDILTVDSNNILRKRTPAESLLDIGAVPYTGANQNVNLGEFGLSSGHIKLDTTPTNIPTDQGTIFWDEDDKTVAAILNGHSMKIGEDQFYPVTNQTGASIPKGTAVGFAGTLGMSGRLLTAPFLANGSMPSTFFMGVTAETIANGGEGKVLNFGRIRGIDTNSFNEGDVLYVSTTVPGGFQTTVPQAPNNIIQVAAVIAKSATVGTIFVRPTLGSSINKDEGVKITSGQTGDILQLQSNGLFENITKAQYLGGTSSQFVKGDGSLDSTAYQTLLTNPITGTGTVDFIPKFSGNSTVNDSILRQISGGLRTTSASPFIELERIGTNTGITRISSFGRTLVFQSYLNSDIIEFLRFDMTNNRLGLLTTFPSDTLDVNGTARIRTLNNATGNFLTRSATGVLQQRTAAQTRTDIGAVGGTGVSGQVSFWDGTNSQTGDSGLVWDNVNKGVVVRNFYSVEVGFNDFLNSGTGVNIYRSLSGDNTNYPFNDAGSLILQSRLRSSSDIVFVTDITPSWKWAIKGGSGILQSNGAQTIQSSTGNLTLATAGGNGNILLTPNGTGNVGIGTTAPSERLEVSSSSGANISIRSSAAGSNASPNAMQLIFKGVTADGVTPDIKAYIYSQDNTFDAIESFMAFGTRGSTLTEKMRITSAGNVGIGTT